jgi:hypothetical protein
VSRARAARAPLRAAFRVSAGELPPALVDAGALARLERIVAGAPDAATAFGFECRLEAGDGTVDLGVAVAPGNGGREVLAGLAGDLGLERALAGDARWGRIRDFARRWSHPESTLHSWVSFLFLEYDAAAADDSTAVPSLFLALDAPLGTAEPDPSPVRAAVREAAGILAGRPIPPELDAQVARAFEALPSGGWVLHLGVLLGRGAEGVRLSLAVGSSSDAAACLRRLGGEEAAHAVETAGARLAEAPPATQLDLDLAPSLRPRVGLGFRPGDTQEWKVLLRAVERLGACSAEKASGLLRWPGQRRVALGSADFLLRRELSHLKLVCSPGAAPRAKAYFGVTPLPAAPPD